MRFQPAGAFTSRDRDLRPLPRLYRRSPATKKSRIHLHCIPGNELPGVWNVSTPAITVPDEADRATRADAEIRIHGSVGGIPGDLIDIEVCFMGVGKSPTRKLSRVSVPGQQGKVPVIKKTALADEQQSITERTG